MTTLLYDAGLHNCEWSIRKCQQNWTGHSWSCACWSVRSLITLTVLIILLTALIIPLSLLIIPFYFMFYLLGLAFLNELNAIPDVDGWASSVKGFQGFMDGIIGRLQVCKRSIKAWIFLIPNNFKLSEFHQRSSKQLVLFQTNQSWFHW